ncbi:MAG TPA: glycosyl transferase [Methylophilaceae bacterium]
MAFDLDHDWQGNLATPRARIGERAKTRLLIMLSVIWICMGLIGHEPWKPDESQTISIVKSMLQAENLLTPIAVGNAGMDAPPLYYWTATAAAKLLSPVLSMHDAARLATGLWMSITLLMVGMIGRELWGYGTGRQTTFIFLGSFGLVLPAHLLMPQAAALAGLAMGFYALALAKRRPYRASMLLGCGLGIAFLAGGLIPASILLLTAIILALLFKTWHSRSFLIVAALAILFAVPWLAVWPLLTSMQAPEVLSQWWHSSISDFGSLNFWYYIKTLSWYALPALPLALWGIWYYRANLLHEARFQLPITFFIVSMLLIAGSANPRETNALVFLLPLAAIAGGSVETLKRGAAGLLNWFGIMLFGIMAFLIWLGWFAMQAGWPAKLKERMHFLSGVTEPEFGWVGFLFAIAITLIWLLVINRSRRSNRAAVTDWAVGCTMVWSLLMCLWLPWIDSARSYAGVMRGMAASLPANYDCLQSPNLGSAQTALLDYYTGIRPSTPDHGTQCSYYLLQHERGKPAIEPGSGWRLIWEGKRAAERRESFRLYQRIS